MDNENTLIMEILFILPFNIKEESIMVSILTSLAHTFSMQL